MRDYVCSSWIASVGQRAQVGSVTERDQRTKLVWPGSGSVSSGLQEAGTEMEEVVAGAMGEPWSGCRADTWERRGKEGGWEGRASDGSAAWRHPDHAHGEPQSLDCPRGPRLAGAATPIPSMPPHEATLDPEGTGAAGCQPTTFLPTGPLLEGA